MARPPTRKVTRAAQTGGGRTNRGARAWSYWGALLLIVVLGLVGVVQSRDQRMTKLRLITNTAAPLQNKDHWHAAYGVFICDHFEPPVTVQTDPEGIHTHGDGVIHIHPTLSRAAGKNATLARFVSATGMTLNDTSIQLPGGKKYTAGKNKCGTKPAIMQIKVKGQSKPITSNLTGLRFTQDRMVITIAFAPAGAELPTPPSEAQLDQLSDVAPTAGTTATTAPDASASTTAPLTTPTTAAPPTTATPTTAPASGSSTTKHP